MDSRNDETFQGISSAMGKSSTDMSRRKMNDGAQVSSRSSSMVYVCLPTFISLSKNCFVVVLGLFPSMNDCGFCFTVPVTCNFLL